MQQMTKLTTTRIWPGTDLRGQPRRPQEAKCDQTTDLTLVSTRAGNRRFLVLAAEQGALQEHPAGRGAVHARPVAGRTALGRRRA